MNVSDLLDSTQKEWIADETMSATVKVDYFHDSGVVVEGLNVCVDKEKYSKTIKGDKSENSMNFMSVALDEEPTQVDEIKYMNRIYKVREWTFANGMYMVQTNNNKRNSIAHRR